MRVRKIAGVYVLWIRLPFVERAGLNVFRKSDELFVRIGSYKRNVILPQVLQRLEMQEAAFVDDRLEVRFAQADAGQYARRPGRGRSRGQWLSSEAGHPSPRTRRRRVAPCRCARSAPPRSCWATPSPR